MREIFVNLTCINRTAVYIKVGRIKILIMGHFLLTLRISMGHSLIFCVNISDFNVTFSDGL